MTDTAVSLRRKIASAQDLQSVVRTMKALAAASVGQYERSVRALSDYHRAVELGLSACFRSSGPIAARGQTSGHADLGPTYAVVFGSDQGLVGQFNDVVAECAARSLVGLSPAPRVWAVGERVYARLSDAGLSVLGCFAVPTSVDAITPLVGQIQLETQAPQLQDEVGSLLVFHNRPRPGALYEPVDQRLLPLDGQWLSRVTSVRWPTRNPPEVMGDGFATLRLLIREYLFISLYQACAESLASEHQSRLAAMERAEKNIEERLETLGRTFQRQRQRSIDEELFDVVAGYDALASDRFDQPRSKGD